MWLPWRLSALLTSDVSAQLFDRGASCPKDYIQRSEIELTVNCISTTPSNMTWISEKKTTAEDRLWLDALIAAACRIWQCKFMRLHSVGALLQSQIAPITTSARYCRQIIIGLQQNKQSIPSGRISVDKRILPPKYKFPSATEVGAILVLMNRVAVTRASTNSIKKRITYSGVFLCTRSSSLSAQALNICQLESAYLSSTRAASWNNDQWVTRVSIIVLFKSSITGTASTLLSYCESTAMLLICP